jgi:hypothetical protein
MALALAVGLAMALALAVGLAFMPYFWAEAAEANSKTSNALAANTTKTFFIKHLP